MKIKQLKEWVDKVNVEYSDSSVYILADQKIGPIKSCFVYDLGEYDNKGICAILTPHEAKELLDKNESERID